MIHVVFKVWREYPHARINHMWLTLMTNHDQIIKCNGNNTYKIVHMSKEKLDRQGILPTVIQVSGEARQKLEEAAHDGEYEEPTAEQEAEEQALDQLIEEERANMPDAITEEELAALREDTQAYENSPAGTNADTVQLHRHGGESESDDSDMED